ncbi:DNA repair protein RecO [Brachyspira hyodysenteriae]|uniref:DNA repair protein RecO n=1 Tax=Brachyspira hyodysenteriae ATCC 27164 TaxID=1266923 RepID=A0A3B6VPW0_BRAHO|nr:DNA repair protein RecO [Brachyspira hyodysenteriae]ANN62524.1 DNA repair protein RecO [Brachyspira hyodysenteriae ATCC 27164]KLI15452.1 DNA recombination protein RecO [Brachyspira hyodysenteriae]KLI17588.1 DNA recombination protein RecO [Brachyspira hyodysenteriae]KLI21469.1 DNA recombination protein RecO [Brachyspira hyodysenteriae]KLI28844.1 DNA recombination protein RecO [Brachyspira hyodysenteriae]
MIKNTNAFILSYNQYKTSSIIASFLTENSIMQAICHKAKNNSKAFGSDLESISKLNINIYEKKENQLSILKESSIIKNYKILEKSIYSSLAVFYIREVLLYCAKDFDNRYFVLMEKTLDALESLEEHYNDDKIKKIYINILIRAFEMKTLHIAGISPHLDKCTICGNNNDISYYSILEGGLICQKCRNLIKDSINIMDYDIAFMRIIKHTSLIEIIKNEDLKKIYNDSIDNVKYIMNKSIFNHINRTIKSQSVLEEILLT